MPEILVSVVGISYNQAPFIEEALHSITEQDHPHIELILIDDASTDHSPKAIEDFFQKQTVSFPVKFIFHSENRGNCASFNEALALCKGKYVIDFALDDVMLPERISRQVNFFEQCSSKTGIIFSNAEIISEKGSLLKYHYPINSQKKALSPPPQGKVFRNILEGYFICPPTMMMRRSMLLELGGYDGNLAYEDFDLWIRASQNYEFAYQDFISTRYRKSLQSLSKRFRQKRQNPLLASTLIVLEKAYQYCQEDLDFKVLAKNTEYHQRQCFYTENFELMKKYSNFLQKADLKPHQSFLSKIISFLGNLRIRVSFLYSLYLWVQTKKSIFR